VFDCNAVIVEVSVFKGCTCNSNGGAIFLSSPLKLFIGAVLFASCGVSGQSSHGGALYSETDSGKFTRTCTIDCWTSYWCPGCCCSFGEGIKSSIAQSAFCSCWSNCYACHYVLCTGGGFLTSSHLNFSENRLDISVIAIHSSDNTKTHTTSTVANNTAEIPLIHCQNIGKLDVCAERINVITNSKTGVWHNSLFHFDTAQVRTLNL